MMKPVDIYLIRGLAREAAHWGGFTKQLEEQEFVKQVVFLDLPGAGRFHKISSPLQINEYAEFLLSQIPEDSQSKVVVSISLGSMVAVEMACLKPDVFKKIYVINTSFSNLSPFYHRLQLKALKQFGAIGLARSLQDRERAILKMVSHSTDKWEALSQSFAEVAELRPFKNANLVRQLIAAGTYRIKKEKPRVPIVVFNSLGDEMVSPSCSNKLAAHWSLPLYTHPSAGHDIPIDAPEWLIEKLKETL